jgi:DNA-binding transcriptional MerR regulator
MNEQNKNLVSAKDISRRFGVTYPTLNHYTNLGFFDVVVKRGNKRFYEAREIKAKLGIIVKMKNDGYPLRLIRKKLEGQ